MIKRGILQLFLLVLISVGSSSLVAFENTITKKEAVAKVVSEYPGKVLRTATVQRQGKQFYQVRVLMPDGRIINVLVDTETGRLRKQ